MKAQTDRALSILTIELKPLGPQHIMILLINILKLLPNLKKVIEF